MISKTRGVALSFIKYGDTSIISKIYTEKYGIQTYIVNSVRSKKSKIKISHFQPLTLLDMVVYHKENANMNRLSEVKCLYPYTSLSHDPHKVVVAFFIQEFLTKILKSEHANESLFEFLVDSFVRLDEQQRGIHDFHLQFILKLSDFLGFSIASARELYEHIGKVGYESQEHELMDELLNASYGSEIYTNVTQRRAVLKDTLRYYALNYEGITELKSIDVLRDILE